MMRDKGTASEYQERGLCGGHEEITNSNIEFIC